MSFVPGPFVSSLSCFPWTGLPSVRSCCWHSHICLSRRGSHADRFQPRLVLVRSGQVQGGDQPLAAGEAAPHTAWICRLGSLPSAWNKQKNTREEDAIFTHHFLRDRCVLNLETVKKALLWVVIPKTIFIYASSDYLMQRYELVLDNLFDQHWLQIRPWSISTRRLCCDHIKV